MNCFNSFIHWIYNHLYVRIHVCFAWPVRVCPLNVGIIILLWENGSTVFAANEGHQSLAATSPAIPHSPPIHSHFHRHALMIIFSLLIARVPLPLLSP